jgi:hypothetical protein
MSTRSRSTDTVPTAIRRLRVDVESTSKPVHDEEHGVYRCDAEIRIIEGTSRQVTRARLTVHHPRGWMGVSAGFSYDLDEREYPTFAARAEEACLRVVEEFPSDEIISVFMLGTGEPEY